MSVGTDEGADALLAGGLVGHRHDDRDVAVLAAGDELLDAVEHVVVAVAHGAWCAAPPASRADVRLGQAEGAEHLAARQRPQPLLLLRVVARTPSGCEHTGQLLTLDDGRGGAVAGGDLFQHEGQRQVVEARRRRTAPAPPRRRSRARPAPSAPPSGSGARGPSARRCGARRSCAKARSGVADHLVFFGQHHACLCVSLAAYQGIGAPS